MINNLRNICNDLVNNSKNIEEKKKYELILKILKDDSCFYKISIDDAFNILEDLKIPKDKLESTYISLVSNSLKKLLDKK